MAKSSECPASHDGEHHFPVNVQTGIERPDCIYCDKTKAQTVVSSIYTEVLKRRPDLDEDASIDPIEPEPVIEEPL